MHFVCLNHCFSFFVLVIRGGGCSTLWCARNRQLHRFPNKVANIWPIFSELVHVEEACTSKIRILRNLINWKQHVIPIFTAIQFCRLWHPMYRSNFRLAGTFNSKWLCILQLSLIHISEPTRPY